MSQPLADFHSQCNNSAEQDCIVPISFIRSRGPAVFLGSSRHAAILRLSGFVVLLVVLEGCGPELSKSDLGTVVFEVPKVAGSDKPYAMPELGPPLKQKQGSADDSDEPSP